MDTLQSTRLRKSKSPPQTPVSGAPQQSVESLSLLAKRVRFDETMCRQSASIRSNRPNQEQETERLRAVLKRAVSSESSLRGEVDRLETSLGQAIVNEAALRRKYERRRELAASTESSLRREIETLKRSLTLCTSSEASLKREIKSHRSTETTLRQKIEELKESLARGTSTESKLRERNNVLKTTLTHALTSERDMRTSARETREEWEKVEKSLRDEIAALRLESEMTGNDIKGKWVAEQTIQGKVRTAEDTIALKLPRKPREGSSDIHVLLDGLALQRLTKDGPNSTPHLTADAFGSRLLPEFTALERATTGLQQAVNSELRTAYASKWLTSGGSTPQSNPSTVVRNLRLLVILWEASGVEELLGSLTSILGNEPPIVDGEDCAICTDPLSPEHKIVIEGCGHAMCKGCLREYIRARLGEKVWPVQCPICMAVGGPERRAQSITRVLVDELILPTTVLSQWTDFELSQFIIPVTCPKCDKPNLFELAEYNRSTILICSHGCECAWCRDCSRRMDIEAPHDCGDEALKELAGERKWMRCPRPSCRVMVEKNVGCNHITCRCGTHFCYSCGEDITGRVNQHACLH